MTFIMRGALFLHFVIAQTVCGCLYIFQCLLPKTFLKPFNYAIKPQCTVDLQSPISLKLAASMPSTLSWGPCSHSTVRGLHYRDSTNMRRLGRCIAYMILTGE